MKNQDRLLIGGVSIVILIVIAAFVIVLTQPEPTYRSDESAEDVAHNYLLALRNREFERAYRYLSPTLANYPDDVAEFEANIDASNWSFRLDRDATLEIESVRKSSSRTTVVVRETGFSGGSLFDSGQYDSVFDMHLRQEAGDWKLIDADRYWSPCWEDRSHYTCR